MYGIVAELKVYLVEPSAKETSPTLVGRIERHVERVVEGVTSADFLKKIQRALWRAGMRRALILKKDDYDIYVYDEETQDNWDRAFGIAFAGSGSSKGTDGWWILVSGWNDDFRFREDVTFAEKHTLAAPSMKIVIRALPAEWAPRSGEGMESTASRLRRMLQDRDGVNAEELRVRPKIEGYIQDYKRFLQEEFAVKEFSESLRVNLSAIDPAAFGENYYIEQPRSP